MCVRCLRFVGYFMLLIFLNVSDDVYVCAAVEFCYVCEVLDLCDVVCLGFVTCLMLFAAFDVW